MNRFTEFFPYGTQYYRAPTPLPEEWEGDLAEIAKQGYTHIQLRPQWRWHERIRGQYEWDDLDRLFDLALKYNLRVILKPMMETAPDWVFTELGGTRQGFHGVPIEPIGHAAYYVGGWWPCFDNPEVAKAMAEFVTVLVNRYKNHKALWFYNAWNEPRSRPMGQCTCKHSVKKYQDYLRRNYGTIENLNKTLGKAWTSFDTIIPPHSASDYIEMFLWRRWAGESVADQVGVVSDAIRKADPNAMIMCHTGASAVHQDPACDVSNDMLNLEKVDWYGTSLWIPLNPSNPTEFNRTFYISSWLRRVDSDYWCQEFYPQLGPWLRRAHPEFIEQAIYMVIASGSRGMTFWQYRSERFGEESDGYAMRNIDGSPTKRSERCDKVAKTVMALESDFAKSSPRKSKTAIYFDDKNDLLMRLEAMPAGLPIIEHIEDEYEYSYKKAIIGAHAYLRRLGHSADYVIKDDDLTQYSLVIVSCLEMTDESVAENLKAYAANGGTLFIEYPFACRDDITWVTPMRPNSGLDELTGCREIERTVFSEDAGDKIFFGDKEEQVDGWHVTLDVKDVEIIGRWEDGTPAVVCKKFGKGTVITSAGSFSMMGHNKPSDDVPSIYRKILTEAGLDINESALWSYSRYSENYEYRFIFNTSEKKETVEITGELAYATAECKVTETNVTLPLYGTAIMKIKL